MACMSSSLSCKYICVLEAVLKGYGTFKREALLEEQPGWCLLLRIYGLAYFLSYPYFLMGIQ